MKRSTKIATVLTIAGLVLGNLAGANAASKTITCYKGTTVKKVTAANPKCPTGYSTTKPKAAASTPATSKGGTVKINATYKGTITMIWSESDVSVTSVNANGTGDTGGLDKLTGMGSAAPTSKCTNLDGEGTLGSGADTLKVKFNDKALACSADEDAPTTVSIVKPNSGSPNLTILSGTGKYAGATGALLITAKWAIDSVKGTRNTSITIELTGTITTK